MAYTFEYKVADGRSTSYTRREHEKKKIKEHDPVLNKSKGGEGRPAKKQRKQTDEKYGMRKYFYYFIKRNGMYQYDMVNAEHAIN